MGDQPDDCLEAPEATNRALITAVRRGKNAGTGGTLTFARNTPRNQKYVQALSQAVESCGRGAGNSPEDLLT